MSTKLDNAAAGLALAVHETKTLSRASKGGVVGNPEHGNRNALRISEDWLREQAERVKVCLTQILEAQRSRAGAQLRLSMVLTEVKARTKHGDFGDFCKRCHLKQRAVELYLQVGRHPMANEIFTAVGLAKG